MKYSRNLFTGKGNPTKNSKSEQLYDSLHYNNESSVVFYILPTKYQNMYNIFEGGGYPNKGEN